MVRLDLDRVRALEATVRLEGDDIEDARLLASRIAAEEGVHLIEGSLGLGTCEGAATIGLELLAPGTPLNTVVIALGAARWPAALGSWPSPSPRRWR